MKAVSIVLLLAIIGASLQQAAPAPSCSITDVNTPNYYALKWLDSQKVVIHTTPKNFTDANICSGDWVKSGTCCDTDTLRAAIKTRNDAAVARWTSFIGKLGRVRAKLLGGIKKLVLRLNLKDMNDRWNLLNRFPGLGAKFTAVQRALPESQSHLDMLKKWADDFEANIKNFKEQGKTCFDLSKRARASLFCAMCSGAASTYTTAQSANEVSFKINLDNCRTIVNACFPIWKFNFGLTSILQYVNLIKNAKAGDKAATKFMDPLSLSATQMTDLKNTFATCNWDSGAKNVTCTKPLMLQQNNGTNGTNGSNTSNNSSNSTTPIDQTTSENLVKLCKLAFVINKENVFVEGSSDAIDDMSDADADEADKSASTPVSTRLLQAVVASEPTVGVTVDTNNGTTFAAATAESGLTPEASVTTTTAGDATSSKATILTAALATVTGILAAFY